MSFENNTGKANCKPPDYTPQPRNSRKHLPKWQCHICPGRTFTRNSALQAHLNWHAGTRPFSCAICGNTFTRNHDRKTHEATHTERTDRFICGGSLENGQWGCSKRFDRAANLARHFRSRKGQLCIKPILDEEMLRDVHAAGILAAIAGGDASAVSGIPSSKAESTPSNTVGDASNSNSDALPSFHELLTAKATKSISLLLDPEMNSLQQKSGVTTIRNQHSFEEQLASDATADKTSLSGGYNTIQDIFAPSSLPPRRPELHPGSSNSLVFFEQDSFDGESANKRRRRHYNHRIAWNSIKCAKCSEIFVRPQLVFKHLCADIRSVKVSCDRCRKVLHRSDWPSHFQEHLRSRDKESVCEGLLTDGITSWGCGMKFQFFDWLEDHWKGAGSACIDPFLDETPRHRKMGRTSKVLAQNPLLARVLAGCYTYGASETFG